MKKLSNELKEVVDKLIELSVIAKKNDYPTDDIDNIIDKINGGEFFNAEIKPCTSNWCDDCGCTPLLISVDCIRCLSGYGIDLTVCGSCGKVLDKWYSRS